MRRAGRTPIITLLLFDVDGTLIRGSRAARLAFGRAIETCLGVAVDLRGLVSDGKTDQAIMHEIVKTHGLERAVDWPALAATFLAYVGDAVREQPGEVCPGVRPLLEALARRDDMLLALGTGNFEQGARVKLAAHDLDRYFATGGFGDDAIERAAILRTGIRRAEALRGRRFDRVVVIGDTPHDASAAAEIGASSLCVATGAFPVEALSAAGATLVRRELAPVDEVITALDALPAGQWTDPR